MGFLVGERIKLVKFGSEHITDEYLCWLNTSEVNRYLCVGRLPICRDEIKIPSDDKNLRFAIVAHNLLKDGTVGLGGPRYIGTLSLHNIDWICRKGEVGYMIGNQKYWGSGIATEAIGLITDYGFRRLNLNKMYAGVVDGNGGSSGALVKNGYIKYATIPQEYFLEDKYLDVSMYYKLQAWHK